MGYLLLDTRISDEAKAWWLSEKGEECWQAAGRAQGILRAIAREQPLLSSELKGVAVVAGPGRFSALRVGILYAHLLARWYKTPLFALTPADIEAKEARTDVVKAIQAGLIPELAYVAPIYDREPTITTPRV